jgi:hypothetical protein
VEHGIERAHQIGEKDGVSTPRTNGGGFADLFTDDGTDPLELDKLPPLSKRSKRVRAGSDQRHIGCPLWWFKLALSIMRSKNEFAVALYVYRLRMVYRSRTVSVSNERLLAELKIDRHVKYRALQKLADAGVIRIRRHKKRALAITFTDRKHGGRP